jgi:hypothetical protein
VKWELEGGQQAGNDFDESYYVVYEKRRQWHGEVLEPVMDFYFEL